jgi:hypothetical protein
MKPFPSFPVALALFLGFAPLQSAIAAPPAFSLDYPLLLSLSPPVPGFDYALVAVTSHSSSPIAIQNPATFSDPAHFWDTQAGSCWQQYEVFGNPIPPKNTCTIQVGFHSDDAGTFESTMTVYLCTAWHADPVYNMIVCDATGASQTIDVMGTAH